MPHTRITQDALLLGGSLASASSMSFPWPDWATLIGPASGLVVSLIMLSVFVRHSRDRLIKEDARHKDELKARSRHSRDFIRLQMSTNRTLTKIAASLERRPCLCKDKIEVEEVMLDDDEEDEKQTTP